MKLMAYDSPDSDAVHQVDALYLDGYLVGKRHLEGVPIKVTLDASGEDIEISADWPKGLDVAYWSQQAKERALRHDLFSTTPELYDDDGYIETE